MMLFLKIIVSLVHVIQAYRLTNIADDNQNPTVTIKSGKVIGSQALDGEYYEFLGIPYADTTSGSHRFKAPLPPPSFIEPFVANRRDIKCVRALGVGYEGTEDCLVANVFTPMPKSSKKLPVMVWIKGKVFDKNSEKTYSFKNFVENEVVVVTLNFRESILGFLCLGNEVAPGNAGLKDIMAGLQWIQENIAEFGGDPDDVTLFGHGTGASAVDLITISAEAKGLIHKAIAQSGTAFAPWAVSRNNLYHAVQVALALGHTITNVEDLSEIFSRASVPTLMAAINELKLTDNSLAFSPCIERENLDRGKPFLTKTPFKIISDGEYLKIPFLTGFVDKEGIIKSEKATDTDWLKHMDNNFSDFLQADLTFENNEDEKHISESIKSFYFDTNSINEESVDQFIKYTGDTMIIVSTIREARMRSSSSSSSPVYLYQFSYKGTLSEISIDSIPVESAAHGDELSYLFPDVPLISDESEVSETDLTISDILTERWTNFAKYGSPTSDTSNVKWNPFTIENPQYIRIINGDEMSEPNKREEIFELDLVHPHSDTMSFWNGIYEEHFLDARSSWVLDDRDDDNDGNGEDEDENGDKDEEENVSTEPFISTTGNPTETTTTDDDEPDSASTAVGYTFAIIALFAVLDKFHSLILLS
ncbi:hypothetical protein ACJJTC_015553 [Scirpophaga incertulas]